jgi:hypothetical protein
MRKFTFLIVSLFVLQVVSHAQAGKAVFFELGGPGLASINFDTRFTGKQDGIGGRVGVGGFSVDGNGIVFVPIGVNYLLGKDDKHYFELGGGFTPTFASGDDVDDDGKFTTTFGHLMFGYRLAPAEGGFTFRAFISPVFGKGFFIPYYGGVSFGYKF